ncbi:protein of unknown function [Cribrihabitans marinus]|uniref:Uncharacterized protein n=1 Tax=Cribrihabitans marinus TaxID=1227549 RepID=A0A1H7B3A9_9RHOB|nr:site-specific integrase [Cribrihabitans marinus]GGH32477.1 integrase [Cribrihabitans marinus]SEJ68730.1 protein of unknown function [Cribrihabitans marinus]
MARGINKLTAAQIKSSSAGSVLQDGGGLILRRSAGGGRWTYRYQFQGRRRDMGIGSFPDMPLAEARKQRARWAEALERGLDPISERQREQEAAIVEHGRDDPSFEEVTGIVFEAIKGRLKGDGRSGRWLSPLKIHVIPKIGRRPISTIHQRDIHDTLAPIWRTKHETADKALYRARKVFEMARLMGYSVDPFVCDAARHMLGHVAYQQQPIRSTPWQDIPDLFARLDQPHPSYLALRFTILTAARGMPIRGARFDEIDGDVWTIPAERMKGLRGKVSDFRIPLSTAAQEVVDACRSNARNDYLFPSPRAQSGVSDVAMTKALNALGESGRMHGFRTSFRTWVQDTEAGSWEVAETALAHTIGNKVERSYARSDLLDQRRILMQKWGDYVTQSESSESKVVKLRG